MNCLLAYLMSVCLAADATATGTPDLAFHAADGGFYQFNTGVLQGRVRLDGKYQGIPQLIHLPTGVEVANSKLPGLLSPYRVFSTDQRYGDAVRDWPTVSRILEDGTLEVSWPAADTHPLELMTLYRWVRPDTLELEIVARPLQDMPRFEFFLSSYFTPGSQALVYVNSSRHARGEPQLLAADWSPLVEGSYLVFPRDRESLAMIFDRRWEFPPSPVQWSVTRQLAGPLALRRLPSGGVTALLMASPEDCFAVATPYNKTPPDNVAAHDSLYLSFFGRDVQKNEPVRARCRLIVGTLSDAQALELYHAYLAELAQKRG